MQLRSGRTMAAATKPKIKNIKMETFKGDAMHPNIEDYLARFTEAEETDILLYDSTWNDQLRKAIFVTFLKEDAATWYDQVRKEIPRDQQTWAWLQQQLRERYRQTETNEQIREAIRSATKKPSWTWKQFMDHLMTLERRGQQRNLDVVLATFCDKCDAKCALQMRSKIITEGAQQSTRTAAEEEICRLTGHDGSKQQRQTRANKVSQPRNNKKTKKQCQCCKRRGHTADECRTLKSVQQYLNRDQRSNVKPVAGDSPKTEDFQ